MPRRRKSKKGNVRRHVPPVCAASDPTCQHAEEHLLPDHDARATIVRVHNSVPIATGAGETEGLFAIGGGLKLNTAAASTFSGSTCTASRSSHTLYNTYGGSIVSYRCLGFYAEVQTGKMAQADATGTLSAYWTQKSMNTLGTSIDTSSVSYNQVETFDLADVAGRVFRVPVGNRQQQLLYRDVDAAADDTGFDSLILYLANLPESTSICNVLYTAIYEIIPASDSIIDWVRPAKYSISETHHRVAVAVGQKAPKSGKKKSLSKEIESLAADAVRKAGPALLDGAANLAMSLF